MLEISGVLCKFSDRDVADSFAHPLFSLLGVSVEVTSDPKRLVAEAIAGKGGGADG